MRHAADRVKIVLVVMWLAFTVTLATWWLIFGLRQSDRIYQLAGEGADQLQGHYQMLLWEGGILILSLVGGGVALFYYARHEQKRHAQVEEFFAAFTHDAKTSLASLRLQAESLKEDLGAGSTPVLDRLLHDTLRLQLQLENSLFLVNMPSARLLLEPVRIRELVDSLRYDWPQLKIVQDGDGVLLADVRAIESLLTNVVHNAVTHGQADEIRVTARESSGRIKLQIADNGEGFNGDFRQLGKLFVRPTRGSGSGVGLYISRQLAQRMNSTLDFKAAENGGFIAQMNFPSVLSEHPVGAEEPQRL